MYTQFYTMNFNLLIEWHDYNPRRVDAGSQCLKQQVCWGAGSTQDVHSRTVYCMRSGQFAFPHANDLATTVSIGAVRIPLFARIRARSAFCTRHTHIYNMVVAWRTRDKDNSQLDLYDDLQRCAGHDLARLVCQLLPLPLFEMLWTNALSMPLSQVVQPAAGSRLLRRSTVHNSHARRTGLKDDGRECVRVRIYCGKQCKNCIANGNS
ncbi:hypothetical protein CBL_01357 [Carabus blaptoides fortunei]